MKRFGATESSLERICRRLDSPQDGLTEVALGGNDNIGVVGARILATSLQNNTTVKKIILQQQGISDDGTVALAKALAARNCDEESLLLGYNRIGPVGMTALTSRYLVKSLRLVTLDLGGNPLGQDGIGVLADALPAHPSLQKLYLFDCQVSAAGAALLAPCLAANQTLTTLSLGDNPQMGNEGVGALADQVVAQNTPLQHLWLWNVGMSTAGVLALANALRTNRQLLDLNVSHHDTAIDSLALVAVADVLREDNGTLKEFKVDKTQRELCNAIQELLDKPILAGRAGHSTRGGSAAVWKARRVGGDAAAGEATNDNDKKKKEKEQEDGERLVLYDVLEALLEGTTAPLSSTVPIADSKSRAMLASIQKRLSSTTHEHVDPLQLYLALKDMATHFVRGIHQLKIYYGLVMALQRMQLLALDACRTLLQEALTLTGQRHCSLVETAVLFSMILQQAIQNGIIDADTYNPQEYGLTPATSAAAAAAAGMSQKETDKTTTPPGLTRPSLESMQLAMWRSSVPTTARQRAAAAAKTKGGTAGSAASSSPTNASTILQDLLDTSIPRLASYVEDLRAILQQEQSGGRMGVAAFQKLVQKWKCDLQCQVVWAFGQVHVDVLRLSLARQSCLGSLAVVASIVDASQLNHVLQVVTDVSASSQDPTGVLLQAFQRGLHLAQQVLTLPQGAGDDEDEDDNKTTMSSSSTSSSSLEGAARLKSILSPSQTDNHHPLTLLGLSAALLTSVYPIVETPPPPPAPTTTKPTEPNADDEFFDSLDDANAELSDKPPAMTMQSKMEETNKPHLVDNENNNNNNNNNNDNDEEDEFEEATATAATTTAMAPPPKELYDDEALSEAEEHAFPLHKAVKYRQVDVLKYASLDALAESVDSQGRTVADFAALRGEVELLKVIEARGAVKYRKGSRAKMRTMARDRAREKGIAWTK